MDKTLHPGRAAIGRSQSRVGGDGEINTLAFSKFRLSLKKKTENKKNKSIDFLTIFYNRDSQ